MYNIILLNIYNNKVFGVCVKNQIDIGTMY